MIDLALSVLESLAGLPAAAVGASLLIYAIYRMARHDVLLFGSVTRNDGTDTEESDRFTYTYSFLIQNLEEVTFPGPFQVILRDRRYTDDTTGRFDVKVLAGPRHVTAWTVPADQDAAVEEWHGRFERLTPFDTWRIEVTTQSKWVELEIDTGDVNRTLFHRLIVDLSQRKIALDAEHPIPQVFKGTAVTPGLSILLSIVMAAVLTYVSAIRIIDSHREYFGVQEFPFGGFDWYVAGALIALLWLGYRRIQRPVYPIIQGYFLETRVMKGKAPPAAEVAKPFKTD